MDFLYSLYDALVSINVPSDKARAVVDAMERDMGTTLATKSDLDTKHLLLKQEVAAVRDSLKQEITGVQGSLKQEIAAVHVSLKQEIAAVHVSLKQEIATSQAGLELKMELLRSSMTIRLGVMLVGAIGLLLAALRLTSGLV